MTTERVRIGEVLALQRREVAIDPIKDYRLVGIYSFGKGIFHRSPKMGSELGEYRFFAVKPGDLVLSNIQAWEGAIAHATKVDAGIVGTHRFLTYVPIAGRIDTNWARWFLLSEPGMTLIRRAAPGSTMRNRTLSIGRFEALEIPLPPIEEQRRVVCRLDRTSRHIRAISEQSPTKRATIVPVLDGWLDTAIDQFDERRGLAEIAVVTRGRSPRYETETGLLAINQACVRWNGLDLTRAREVEKEWWTSVPETGRVRAGDVLVNSTGEGTIGRVTLATTSAAYGIPFDSHVLVVRCDESILMPEFLAIYLRSRDGQNQVNRAKGANTTKQTELGKNKLERFTVPVPSMNEQALLVSRFREIQGRTHLIEHRMDEQAERLTAVVPAVLNEAFTGLA
jgi:type I restriction enzyme, S subunit